MVCTIHKWLKWSNIWFASYIDGSDGQIYAHNHRHHHRIAPCILQIFFFSKKKFFFSLHTQNSGSASPKDQRPAYGQNDAGENVSKTLIVGAWSLTWRRGRFD